MRSDVVVPIDIFCSKFIHCLCTSETGYIIKITFKSIIEKDKNILAIRYGNSIRSLKHVPKKSGVLKFLDMKSEDRKNDIYKRSIICALYGN